VIRDLDHKSAKLLWEIVLGTRETCAFDPSERLEADRSVLDGKTHAVFLTTVRLSGGGDARGAR
jgi:hypothetical protein